MMRRLVPFSVALLLTACAVPLTPEDREEAHQRQLAKEARENFYALKAQEHPGFVPPQPATPTPAPGLFSSLAPRRVTPRPHFPPTRSAPRVADDTVYYWQVPQHPSPVNSRFRAAEAKYARQLAKRPEDLSTEEILWAHEHY